MLSSIKGLFKKGKDTTVSSKDLFKHGEEEQVATIESESGSDQEEIFPTISFHPLMMLEDEKRYVYQFLSNELPPLKPNQVSLSAIELVKEENGVSVLAFVRNSLPKSFSLQNVMLLLLNEERELLAKKLFTLEDLGELPACSSRPHSFFFETDTLTKEEMPESGFQLLFDLSTSVHRLALEPSWEERLSEDQKQQLSELVSSLPKLGENEVSFHAVNAGLQPDGTLAATLLVRNGAKQAINLEQLPLELINENNELIASGSFKLPPLIVQPNTSKPWTFIFPAELVQLREFTKWRIRVPQ
ncbi:accessory Sec system S-layer assembly protein [Bacillus sp. RG28]|uniref:Accessory Sec system S-layer assembly protein n=1 Tax=Gottfriedia endophytica TaxID=2820819 RepID=A0A940NQQ8_9BACI|nr:accessory Sec system S-layer assembly protein [Gottfriedia endophytica]MBP0725141.1 accessory Sec system S-layer assembly protein [Gottfriedia endophytica]